MHTYKVIISALVVGLNVLHLFYPFEFVLNKSYNPIISLLSLAGFIFLIHFSSELKKDYFYIFLVGSSLFSQIVSFYKNSGVPDYINFGVFHSNLPDLVILSTILTWWYLRVYKYPNSKKQASVSDIR